MVVPIRALQVGARQLEASDFGHRIEVRTGDEIEDLADHFNRMADQLQGSYSRLEQKVEERTRDLQQSVSELKALEEIGRAVASSLDTKSVLATIVTRAVRAHPGGRRRDLQLRRGARRVRARRGARARAAIAGCHPRHPIKLDESILGLSAKQARADLYSRPAAARRIFRSGTSRSRPASTPFWSCRCSAGRDLGALVLQRHADRRFSRRARSASCRPLRISRCSR